MSRFAINIPISAIPKWTQRTKRELAIDINITDANGENSNTIYTVAFSFTDDGELQLSCYEVSNPDESIANSYPEYQLLHGDSNNE